MDILTTFFTSEFMIVAIVTIVGAIVTPLLRRAAAAFEAFTGIRIEQRHQEVLHEAIKTSVEAALRHGPEIAFENLRANVVHHIKEGSPDALDWLKPTEAVLDRLIQRFASETLSRMKAEQA